MITVAYCIGNHALKKAFPLSSRIKTSGLKDIARQKQAIVIFDRFFLDKHAPRPEILSGKLCFIYFEREDKTNLKLVKKYGFFGYFTSGDTKESVNFKLSQARAFLRLRVKLDALGIQIAGKDKQLEKFFLVDPLTGCYNWRYFLERAYQELSRARRHVYDISFIAVDIDYFRQINELYSVKMADRFIKKLVSLIKKNLRREDILVRWRGDEFLIILPYLSRSHSCQIANRIKRNISGCRFKYKSLSLRMKASIGVVSYPEDGVGNTRDVINALEKCLVEAKRMGGDVVLLHSRPDLHAKPARCSRGGKTTISDLRCKIEKLNILLTRDMLEMIYGFAKAIQAKDFYTGQHVEYTSKIAEEVAAQLSLPVAEVENVKRAGILHDLGKVGIDERILSKKGSLTARERKIIQTHPWIATEILREIHALRGAMPAILYHHERFDGRGYPLGLKGQEIPLAARIVAIADVYQALISSRPYRKAFSRKKAITIIKSESGKHFDPCVVRAFLKIIDKVTKSK